MRPTDEIRRDVESWLGEFWATPGASTATGHLPPLPALQERLARDVPELLARLAWAETHLDLATQLAWYLETRQHTLSTAHLPHLAKLRGEADYVRGEADELRDAVCHYVGLLTNPRGSNVGVEQAEAHVRHELADTVLAATVLAGFLGTTVEACIAEKTELDRGRG